MLKLRNTLILAFLVALLGACGSPEDENKSAADSTGAKETLGSVLIQQGPIVNASVIVKTYEGQDAGKATTNADGQYKVDNSQPGLFIAEARDPAGKAYYSVGQSANMNITHLGDYLFRQWFQARGQDVESAFASGAAASSFPNVQELNVLANQIVAVPAYAMQKQPTELFGGEMTATLAKILKGTTIESDTQLRINLPENNFNGIYTLKAPQLNKGVVVFEGSEETSSDNVPLVKGSIAASVGSVSQAGRGNINGRLLRAASSPMVGAVSGGSNEHWMKDNWDYIKDKKLGQIVIPGTHDSGTYQLAWGTGGDTAKTQINSIGDQLKDGIRYFDLRVREAHHRKCADPSVWWLFHTWDSYRLQVALDEIVSFLTKPGNENEVIILDFQETDIGVYDDERARNTLLGMIQDKLEAFTVKSDGNAAWKESKLNDLVNKNQRVVVLLENGLYNRIQAESPDTIYQCYGKKIAINNFSNRTKEMVSAYDEDYAKSSGQIQYLISSEFDTNFMTSQAWFAQYQDYQTRWKIYEDSVLKGGMRKKAYNLLYPDSALLSDEPVRPEIFRANIDVRVKNYKEFQPENRLRVLQLVSRPSNAWYAAMAAAAVAPDDLLTYAVREINRPLNYKGSCAEGWLGKRLRMGMQGDPSKWNSPNIIITDNYKASDWVIPSHNGSRWTKGFSGSYVDMIIQLNKMPKSEKQLFNISDMQDGQCLQ